MAVELVGNSFAALDSAAMRGRSGCRIKRANNLKPLLPNPSFFLHFFLWCDLLLTGSHHFPSVSTISLPPSKSPVPIHELILLMSGQCTNPGSPYPCPVCLHPFKKCQFSFKWFGFLSWVYQKCSGLASYTLHHGMWSCSKCQTPSSSPLKRNFPVLFIPHLPQFLPWWIIHYFLPDLPHLTGKGDVTPPFSLSSPDG